PTPARKTAAAPAPTLPRAPVPRAAPEAPEMPRQIETKPRTPAPVAAPVVPTAIAKRAPATPAPVVARAELPPAPEATAAQRVRPANAPESSGRARRLRGAGGPPKLFVLVTNVLLHDPTCLFRFEEHDIYLPMIVLEELDSHKKGTT